MQCQRVRFIDRSVELCSSDVVLSSVSPLLTPESLAEELDSNVAPTLYTHSAVMATKLGVHRGATLTWIHMQILVSPVQRSE